jgi:hypothetical protein
MAAERGIERHQPVAEQAVVDVADAPLCVL